MKRPAVIVTIVSACVLVYGGVFLVARPVLAADEIEQSAEVILEAGLLKIEFDPGSKTITQFVPVGHEVVQIVGTAMEAFDVSSDVAYPAGTNGISWFLNTDTNPVSEEVYVEIGAGNGANFYPFIRLKSGEFCMLRLHPTNQIQLKASHANTILRGGILHD